MSDKKVIEVIFEGVASAISIPKQFIQNPLLHYYSSQYQAH